MMTAKANGPSVHRHPAVWISRLKTKWPIVIWLAAVACAYQLYRQQGPPTAFVGLLYAPREAVAPLTAGRVREVAVGLGDRVEAGTVVAHIEPEAVPTDPNQALENLRVQRQFAQLVQDAETTVREAELERARDEAELGALTAELERLEALRERGLVDEEVIARVRIPQAALQKAVDLYPAHIAHLNQQLADAREMQGTADARLAAMPLPGAAPAIESAASSIELRALHSGTVTDVPAVVGSVVRAGDPVVTLLTDSPQSVVGYVHESQTIALASGQIVYLQGASGSGEWVPGTVVAVSPDIAPLPYSFSACPGKPYADAA